MLVSPNAHPTDNHQAYGLGWVVCSFPVVAAVLLMGVNDHFLKVAGVLPGCVTGKLSDFAFLFFAPIVLVFVVQARSRNAQLLCYGIPSLLFVAINTSDSASVWFASSVSAVFPMRLWPDPTDLIALLSVPLSWLHLKARVKRRPQVTRLADRRRSIRCVRPLPVLLTVVASLLCMATSPHMPPTHSPRYMSWEAFRSKAVRILPPRRIATCGKLVVADRYLFLSEPGKGIHMIDNSDPRAPRQVLFVQIPGNIDIAVDGALLYADSFVDLLTFKVDYEGQSIALIGRLEDQFEYNPYQVVPRKENVILDRVEQKNGVVVDIVPLAQPDGRTW